MTTPAVVLTAHGFSVTLDADVLRPLIEAIVSDVHVRIGDDGRLAYSEAEAAALMGVPRHTLRDCRLRGEVQAVRVGKQIRYSRAALVGLLEGGGEQRAQWEAHENGRKRR